MRINVLAIAAVAQVIALTGCANTTAPVTPSARLKGPAEWAMTPAIPLDKPKAGEDAKELLGQCRAAYGYETTKLEPLQRFAKRVTRKP